MNKKVMITKANILNEARYRLSVLEQKLILTVVSKISPNDEDFKPYKLKVSQFIELLELSRKSVYEDIKRISETLMSKVLTIIETDDEQTITLMTHWFSSVKYYDGKGYVEFRFDPNLKSYLLQLKNCFITYQINNIVQLKSFYSIRFYELLKQYENLGYRSFEVIKLREILGIKGNEYKEYKNFKARVLEPAIEEVSRKTDILISYTEIKEKRKVIYLRFDIVNKDKAINNNQGVNDENKSVELTLDHLNNPDFNGLINLLPKEEQEKKSILTLLAHYFTQNDPVYVARNIKYANKHSKQNYRVFLTHSLVADWGLEIQEEEQAKQNKAMAGTAQRKINAKTEIENKQKQKQINDYIKANEKELKVQAMKTLDKEMLKELKEKSPLGRLALIGAMSQIATKKLSAKA